LDAGQVDVKKKKITRGHYLFSQADLQKLRRFSSAIRTVG